MDAPPGSATTNPDGEPAPNGPDGEAGASEADGAPPTGAPEAVSFVDRYGLDLVGLAGIAGLVGGAAWLADGELGFDLAAALGALGGLLPETLPAAVLVLAAVALNLAAGGVLARLVLGVPFRTRADAVLAAFATAVLLDLALLVVLGGLGIYRDVALAVAYLVPFAFLRRARPFLATTPPAAGDRGGRPHPAWWAFLVAAWASPVLLQLASPVVPFTDVLPNHVAPAEHLRTFGSWAELGLTQSPIYGPSRSFLGYTALSGAVATLTGLPAALAVAALALPTGLLIALVAWHLARVLGGAGAARWALLAFVLTTSFARLADARATVVVLPLALFGLALLVEHVRRAQPAAGDPAGGGERPPARDWVLVGAALGGAILVHPVIGAIAFVAAGLAMLARPERLAPVAVPGLVMAGVLALLQLATMVGLVVPTLAALPVLAAAPAVGWLVRRIPRLMDLVVSAGRALVVYGGFLLVLFAAPLVEAAVEALGPVLASLPLLLLGSLAAVALARRRVASPVVLGALAAAAIAAAAAGLAPAGDPLLGALRYEMGKTLEYWIPVVLAIVAAIGIDAAWRHPRLAGTGRLVLLAGLVLAMGLPVRSEPIDKHYLGERRLGEIASQALHWVERGYWTGYPDARRVMDAPRRELAAAVRAEIDAGRIRADTEVLHVARSFQQWVATPLGVFTGVIETMASVETEASMHTAGGRLHPITDLDALLGSGRFDYVVLEPHADLPADTRDRIVAAGFSPVFAGAQGEIFRRGGGS